jgi:hypothetical protein
MWSYYGSKGKIIDHYPRPKFGKIIEPFAGSARYSLKWFDRDVLLTDKYPVMVKIWQWLQICSVNDILSLPTPDTGDNLNDYAFDCEEAKWLMGFLIKGGMESPRLTVTNFRDSEHIISQKKSIAKQLFKIKHWEIKESCYQGIPNQEATWFIDPPYQFGGEHYKHSSKSIDFTALSVWCKARQGQTMVCENTKADWMDFKPMIDMQGSMFKTTEAIWSNIPTAYDNVQQDLFAQTA